MLKYILISFLIITNAYAYTCEEMGYTKTIADCPEGGLKCPAEPEKMFCCDPCGNKGGYRYDSENCSPDAGLQVAGVECGGYWTECRQCSSEYKYNKDNCRSPKILAGSQCANSYTRCVYPTGTGCIPTVGYIYYADGSCHADYDNTKEALGIIYDAANKLVVSLDEKVAFWNDGTTNYQDIPELTNFSVIEKAQFDMEGLENTNKIVAFALSNGQTHEAAEFCYNKTSGNKKWYLPALGELIPLYTNINDVQKGLENIPTSTKIRLDMTHTSTESGIYYIWYVNMSTGKIQATGNVKYYTHPTRCIFKF